MSARFARPGGQAGNVAEFTAGGRARWKIENETFNVLKTKGYNLEHNFGHGKQHLATVLAILNLPGFACHTVRELADRAWRAASRQLVTRQGFFQSLRTITTYLVFPAIHTWAVAECLASLTRTPCSEAPPFQRAGGGRGEVPARRCARRCVRGNAIG